MLCQWKYIKELIQLLASYLLKNFPDNFCYNRYPNNVYHNTGTSIRYQDVCESLLRTCFILLYFIYLFIYLVGSSNVQQMQKSAQEKLLCTICGAN